MKAMRFPPRSVPALPSCAAAGHLAPRSLPAGNPNTFRAVQMDAHFAVYFQNPNPPSCTCAQNGRIRSEMAGGGRRCAYRAVSTPSLPQACISSISPERRQADDGVPMRGFFVAAGFVHHGFRRRLLAEHHTDVTIPGRPIPYPDRGERSGGALGQTQLAQDRSCQTGDIDFENLLGRMVFVKARAKMAPGLDDKDAQVCNDKSEPFQKHWDRRKRCWRAVATAT